MSKLSDLHNELAGKIVADIVKPVLAAGGTSSDYLVLLESVVVGVMLTMPPGAGDKDGDLARCLHLCRAAALRCADLRKSKAKTVNWMVSDISPAMPIKPCEHVRKLPTSPEHYRSSYLGRAHSLAYQVSRFGDELDIAWCKDQAIHAENEPAITHNKATRDRIAAIMKAAGIDETYYGTDPHSRSRWPKQKKMQAGYIGDLARTFPIGDGFEVAKQAYEQRAKALAEAKAKVDQEKVAAERQAAAEKEKRKADLALAGIIIRYGLAVDATWGDALEALRKRDKYLDLAVAGALTRDDWSDGFWRVEDALKRFKIDNDQDKNIAADLCGCMGSDDGRIFRDTTWSYDQLFALVEDKRLLADAQTCMENQ